MNPRSAQFVAAALAFLLIALTGAVIFVLLSRPSQSPRPTPSHLVAVGSPSPATSISPGFTPTPVPTGSPAPTPSPLGTPDVVPTEAPPTPTLEHTPTPTLAPTPTPTLAPTPTPTLAPTPTPTLAPTPTPTLAPTPTPTPTPQIIPTSPARHLKINGLGLDNRSDPAGVERYFLFSAEGPSLIKAAVSSNNRVRMCMWQGSQVQDQQCRTVKNGSLEWGVIDAGSTSWTLKLIGVPPPDILVATVADVTLDFNANSPRVKVQDLRFQGQAAANHNGITAVVETTNAGQLHIDGAFDNGASHAAHIVIEQLGDGGGVVYDETSPSANTFSATQAAAAGTSYRLTVSNPADSEPGPVFVEVTIGWP